MRRGNLVIVTAVFGWVITIACAGIPEPDVILWGTVAIDAQAAGAGDDVAVIARVAGVPEGVGYYHMSENPAAGDYYVLHVCLESLADGSVQSANAALVGQVVKLYVQGGTGPEMYVGSVVITERGMLLQRDLSAWPDDLDGDGDVDLGDFSMLVNCLAGPGVGTPPSGCTPEQFDRADLTGDNDVDLADFAAFQSGFGRS